MARIVRLRSCDMTKSACTRGKSACNTVMYTFYLAGTLVEELDYAF